MGAMNWYQMYQIDTSTIWHEAIGAENIPESCYEELYNQLLSLMGESEEKYTKKIDKEVYDAQRHFYFVDLCEKFWNRNSQEKFTYIQKVDLGYIVKPNNTIVNEINTTWHNTIKETLNQKLPDRLKKNNEENTRILVDKFLPPNTSIEERDECIEFQMTRHTLNTERLDEDDIEEAYRWTYDIYWFRHSNIILTYNSDDINEKKYFTFFFAWAVAILDLELIDDFLKYHFKNNFNNNWNEFGKFLEILLMKHDKTLLNSNQVQLIRKYLDSNPYSIFIVDNYSKVELEEEKGKLGRKTLPKIEIPKPIARTKGDKRTIFSSEDTAKLFSYLAQLNCVFNNQSEISKASFGKAIEALTGFSSKQIEGLLIYENYIHKNKNEKKKLLESIYELILKNL